MPRGVPNKKPEETNSMTAEVEPEVEIKTEKAAPKPDLLVKKIPILSVKGKAIDVTEYEHAFENIHIRKDVPLHVLALAFEHRVGEGELPTIVKQEFFIAQSLINLYATDGKKSRFRHENGVIHYGAESFVVPGIPPEALVRIIDDRVRTDTSVRRYFAGKKEVQFAKLLASIKKTIDLLVN